MKRGSEFNIRMTQSFLISNCTSLSISPYNYLPLFSWRVQNFFSKEGIKYDLRFAIHFHHSIPITFKNKTNLISNI